MLYPNMTHVHEIGLGTAQDDAVWAFAREHGFAIISKDSDFAERSVLERNPVKVIWISSWELLHERRGTAAARSS